MFKLYATLGLLVLTQCSPHKADGGKDGRAFAPDPASAFSVTARLTPAAVAKLKALDGALVIDVSYYGYPTPASKAQANRLGQIDLGREKVLASSGANPATLRVDFQGKLNKAAIAEVAAGEVRVLVNGYSVTKVGAKNAEVSCGYYREVLSVAQKAPVVLDCDVAPL